MSIGSFFGELGSKISAVGDAISRGVSILCTTIGGTKVGQALATGVSKLVSAIGAVIPQLNIALKIIDAICIIASIVSKIAEAIKVKEKDADEPDELAMKAEKSDKKPDDFESTEAYIKYIQNEVKLTDEEKAKLRLMDEEKRAEYMATGTYLYTKCINEKLGLDNTGLKNPELVGITVGILADLQKLGEIVLPPSDFVVYTKHMQAAGLSLNDFSKYLHNTNNDLTTDKKVQNAIVDAMKEINPNISQMDIDKKLSDLNIEE